MNARHRLIVIAGLLASTAALAQPKLPTLTPHTLTVTKSGSGTGSVESLAGGLRCGDKCSNAYSHGVPVQLTARNGSGVFRGWGGACSGMQTSCSFVMDGSKTVIARFERPKLVIEKQREFRDTTVVSQPAGIDCGGRCGVNLDAGTTVSLQVSGMPDGWFAQWSPASVSGGSYTMDSEVVLLRLGGEPSLKLSVAGNGRVTSSPPGIEVNGSGSDSHPFAPGTAVTFQVQSGSVDRWFCRDGMQPNCSAAGARDRCTVVVPRNAPLSCTVVVR